MQVYANSNRLSLKTILFFIIVLFIAFLPVSSFMFFLKNDAFNGYFPPKFFMSESLHSGHLPLWNPYINFGIPQYGDMSGGYWSPVTWLVAATIGYNAYTLTLEILLYILLGGLGVFTLSRIWITHKHIRIIAGIAYMCCGYNIGHLQHFNWLSGAAFLPWCLWSYLLLLNNFTLRNSLVAALFFYLLVASAHPGITIASIYFFAATLIFHFISNEKQVAFKKRILDCSKIHILFIFFFLLLGAGMITGYLDILPHFVRGEKISLEDSLGNPTNIQSWISALLPFATVKNDAFYQTDPTMRNSYFSLSLLLFFLLACLQKKNNWQKFLLFMGVFFTCLSAGGIFKTIAYKAMPFIGYVRLNGEFRIFALLCFIIIAAIALEKYIQNKNTFSGKIKWIYYSIEIVLFAGILFGLYKALNSKESVVYSTKNIFSQPGITLKLKAVIDAISFYDTFWIQGIIQLFFLWGIKWCLKFEKWHLFKRLTIINMILACLVNIPYTGAGKASVAQVQSVLNRSPKGIPIPVLKPIITNDTLNATDKGLVGDWSFYNKQIGVKDEVPYPIILNNMRSYFEKNKQDENSNFLNNAFIFIAPPGIKNQVSIEGFSPQKINVLAFADTASLLILQQNYYPHWYYENGAEKKQVNPAGINFMSAPLEEGQNNIRFTFDPTLVKWMMFVSALSLLFVLVFIFILKPTQPFLS